MFLIVEMMEEGRATVDVVPDIWFDNSTNLCAWPPVKNTSLYVKSRRPSTNQWKRYPSRILHEYGKCRIIYALKN